MHEGSKGFASGSALFTVIEVILRQGSIDTIAIQGYMSGMHIFDFILSTIPVVIHAYRVRGEVSQYPLQLYNFADTKILCLSCIFHGVHVRA